MKLFDVYPLFDINIVKGKGCHVWDDQGTEYLDLYGGHAVISIGHWHPHYVEMMTKQLNTLGFYSNSVINRLQQQVATHLGKISGYAHLPLLCQVSRMQSKGGRRTSRDPSHTCFPPNCVAVTKYHRLVSLVSL